jgi:hypothetical protein
MEFYLVGKLRGVIKINGETKCKGKYPIWEFQGIFDDEKKAFDEAMRYQNGFFTKVQLNKNLPDKTCYFENIIYPRKIK